MHTHKKLLIFIAVAQSACSIMCMESPRGEEQSDSQDQIIRAIQDADSFIMRETHPAYMSYYDFGNVIEDRLPRLKNAEIILAIFTEYLSSIETVDPDLYNDGLTYKNKLEKQLKIIKEDIRIAESFKEKYKRAPNDEEFWGFKQRFE